MYYMLFCCGAIMLLSVIIGFRRGLLKSLLRVIAIIIAVVASFLLSPMVVDLLYEKTDWDEQIEQQIYTKIESGIHSQVVDVLKDSGVKPEDIAEVAEKETRSIMEDGTDKATQMEMIRYMKLPTALKNKIIENNNEEMYNKLNVSGFYRYMSAYLTKIIMNIVGSAGTFIVIQLILLIICLILGAAVKEVPILAGIDKLGGIILGAVVGLAIVMAFMAIAFVVIRENYSEMVGDNPVLKLLDENNIFIKLLMNIK